MSGGYRGPIDLITYGDQEHTVYEWSRITGLPVELIKKRLALQWTPRDILTIPEPEKEVSPAKKCRGCRYLGRFGSIPCCDYMILTGHARTFYKGQKVDLCPRKRKRLNGGVKSEDQDNQGTAG